jgi:hypothetical protein
VIRTLLNRRYGILPAASITFAIILAVLAASPIVHAQGPDFVLTATPSSLCVNPGIDARSVLGIQSTNGFSGNVSLSDGIDPTLSNGPTLSPIPPNEIVSDGRTVNFNLTISTTTSTPDRIYYATVSGFSGTLHQVVVQLTVSSSCSVGGTEVSLNRLGLLSPYVEVALAATAIVGLFTAALLYKTRRNQRTRE